MSLYATRQFFGGFRASVGRIVVLAASKHDRQLGMCLRAGIIRAISHMKDTPYIFETYTGQCDNEWTFVETTTEQGMENLPIGSWTWPLHLRSEREMRELQHSLEVSGYRGSPNAVKASR